MACNLKVSVAQMCSGTDPERNLERIGELASQAGEQGAHYLLTPEMSVAFVENVDQLIKVAQRVEGNVALETCAKIARECALFLHIGSLAIAREDGLFANRSVLFDPEGNIVSLYDKIHLFDADVEGDDAYRESSIYVGGKKATLAQMGNINVGLSICYDVRFGALYRELAKAGAHIIAVPAAFTVPTGKAHWEVLLRARAIETGCFVLAAAQGGMHENGRQTFGHSMIIDPWGKIITSFEDNSSGLIFAELDFDQIKRARQSVPALQNETEFRL
ncbi:MAG: carbon-nitrogen hydrolase family protein [Devosiaceae bacterium]|nr:carbon-nitrogen hydrolase family protein [Devosiaceae bacterium]